MAQSVEVGGEKMTVCELNLLKDTIDLPLSILKTGFKTLREDAALKVKQKISTKLEMKREGVL